MTDAAPARCADMLASGEADAALVPVIEYHRLDDVRIVPDVCVGSHAAVRSVLLISKYEDLREVKSLALDVSSRTSQALVKIIFREFFHTDPHSEPSKPDLPAMLNKHDAALLIGDPAITNRVADVHVFDLAQLWNKLTNTGFVFAMWMARSAAVERVRQIDFAAARDHALKHLEEIVTEWENDVSLSPDEIRKYLTRNITYRLDDSLARGMKLYFELAHKHQLIGANKTLEFISQ